MNQLLDEAQKGFSKKLVSFWNAARDGNLNEVKKYIDNGGDVNLKDNLGFTALMLATANNRVDIVKLLVTYGADVNASDNLGGGTAIKLAKHNHHTEALEILKNPSKYVKTRPVIAHRKKWWQFWRST